MTENERLAQNIIELATTISKMDPKRLKRIIGIVNWYAGKKAHTKEE